MPSIAFPDDTHVDRIAEALWSRAPSGTAAVLVGAGYSRNATALTAGFQSMPGWNDVYEVMVNQLYPPTNATLTAQRTWLRAQTGATSAYLRVAEEFESEYGRDGLDKLIIKHVPDRHFAPGELHRHLLGLPWADVLTTNWDTLLERAAESVQDRAYTVIRTVEEIPEARAPRIIKLHGSMPAHRPFIFTEEDFRTYPFSFAPFVNLAQQLAMENTLVLLGFSGDDPNFLFWTGWVRDRLGPKAPIIYLVGALNLSPAKRKMLEKRKVQPIDLAHLPDFATWPESQRVENANRWFLERLRAAEPYRARRWPRSAPGFVPPLELVVPRPDPQAPVEPIHLTSPEPLVETLRTLTDQWRHNREVYPGWIVPPLDTSELLWTRLRPYFREIDPGLKQMSDEERLATVFELNWQLETALIPLAFTIYDDVEATLDLFHDRYEGLSGEQSEQYRHLALAFLRHAREEGDDALFEKWSAWLAPRVRHHVNQRERLTYERCLKAVANTEIDTLEAELDAWRIEGDPYWLVRKAGLLADVGRETEADALSRKALAEIRNRTQRESDDVASWSRESYALLLQQASHHRDIGEWVARKSVRDRFDLRQDELAARGCSGRQDFWRLAGSLDQMPPRLKAEIELKQSFDIGSVVTTHHLGGTSPFVVRLQALIALRYQEETGIPARIGNAGIAAQMLQRAAHWLIDVAPHRALDAFVRAAPGSIDDAFENSFNRASVARAPAEQADRMITRLLRLADTALARIAAADAASPHWRARLRAVNELLSRFILRLPLRAPEILALAMRLNQSPQIATERWLGEGIRHLARRSIEAMTEEQRAECLPALMMMDVPEIADTARDETSDPAAYVVHGVRAGERSAAWDSGIDLALAAAADPNRRRPAISRLVWFFEARLLTDEQRLRFAEILWAPEFLDEALPGGSDFLPAAFLWLPTPAGTPVQDLVKRAVLLTGPLTGDEIISQKLIGVLATEGVALTADELLCQLRRFQTFVTEHSPIKRQSLPLGHKNEFVIECTAHLFALLARHARGIAEAHPLLAAIADQSSPLLRIEPGLPALVEYGLVKTDTALRSFQELLRSTDLLAPDILRLNLDTFHAMRVRPKDFEAAIWEELALTVVARRPLQLVPALRYLSFGLANDGTRVPATIEPLLTAGLELILAEAEMTRLATEAPYDIFAVRFFAAKLVGTLARLGRGDGQLVTAWEEAVKADPLPDTRRAWQMID